jgi:hypothetical protein
MSDIMTRGSKGQVLAHNPGILLEGSTDDRWKVLEFGQEGVCGGGAQEGTDQFP